MKLWALVGRIAFWVGWPALWFYLRLGGERTRVLVVCGDRLLVTRSWLGSGKWGLPGGGVHAKESPLHGALRELREETGLELTAEQLQFHSKGSHTRRGLRLRYQLFTATLNEAPSVQPQRGEILAARWLHHAEPQPGNAEPDVLMAVRSWWG
jgi:8-oxo-dGTP diphosphatase